ncbi:MAG: LysR family transcriptional regulator [Clostridiales Family XIII bacterium]|jgi:LysR family cyn operon transcriptional activator|nr:LysR family transcriptional regulator [Clostridiales Family XIII bacterium]
MEIRQLQHFRQVCLDRNLSRAAENLYITQQGLSHSIGKLERELGVTLFLRTKNGVVPTEAALSFREDVDAFLLSFDALKQKMQKVAGEAKGSLRLAMTPGATTRFVPWLVGAFSERYPGIDLTILESPDGVIEDQIIQDVCDLGCSHEPRDKEQIEWFPLFRDDVVVMMRRDNPLALRGAVRFADLSTEKFIMLPPEFRWHDEILGLCRAAGFEPHVAYTTWDINITFNLIREVGGIGFLHRDLGQSFRKDEIALVPLHEDEGVRWELGLLRKRGRRQNFACDVLFEYIREIVSEMTDLDTFEPPARREKVGNVIVMQSV